MPYGHPTTLLITLCAILMTCHPFKAYALDPFEFQVYGYDTQGKGHLDPELLLDKKNLLSYCF